MMKLIKIIGILDAILLIVFGILYFVNIKPLLSALAVITMFPVTFDIFILFLLTTLEVTSCPPITTVIVLKVYPSLAVMLVVYDDPSVILVEVLLLLQLLKLLVIV